MIKVLTVAGTRPEAIKMAPVLLELARQSDDFESLLCVTGQHRQMLDQVLQLFDLTPDYDLNVMTPGQTLNGILAAVAKGLDRVLDEVRPDWVLVQGDTTTAMATSLVAFHRKIRLGHIEAGLRTFDLQEPFPEELNRRVISLTADLHFAPTQWAADNLRREAVSSDRIVVTGNTVIDALRFASQTKFDATTSALGTLPLDEKRIIVVTCHRRENHGDRLVEICTSLLRIAATYDDIHLVMPVHLNPLVHEPVHHLLSNIPNITLLPPLDYLPLVWLLNRCHFVITDSGGLQEEAPGLGKPVLVLRETTERPEGVEAGTVRLVGAAGDRLEDAVRQLLTDGLTYDQMARAVNPYGDGHAAQRIVKALRTDGGDDPFSSFASSSTHEEPRAMYTTGPDSQEYDPSSLDRASGLVPADC